MRTPTPLSWVVFKTENKDCQGQIEKVKAWGFLLGLFGFSSFLFWFCLETDFYSVAQAGLEHTAFLASVSPKG